jgi:prevent-host-death family protein
VKVATISYTKNNLSRLLKQVRRGETITILDRNQPVARLEPIPTTGDVDWDKNMDELERKGIARRGKGKIPDWILKEPPPPAPPGFSFAELIREDRDSRP